MLGLGTSITSIDCAQIYKEADEFGNAADLDVWFDFSTLSPSQPHGDEVQYGVTNLGAGGATYNIDSIVDEPTVDRLIFGRSSVRFNGTADEALVLASAYTTTGKAYTWFLVLFRPDSTNDAVIASAADGAEYFQLRGSGASIKVAKADMSSDKTITLDSTSGSTVDYTYQDASVSGSNGIQVIVYNRTSAGVVNVFNHLGQKIAVNSNSVVKSAADMTVGALGATSSGSITDFTGHMGEFGVFDSDIGLLISAELAKNLAVKWGASLV